MNSAKKPVLFSGIQPSGALNIGHYIGAIQHWAKLQNQFDCLFALVDLHTITVTQDPKILKERCYDMAALYIACGVDPEKNLIFMQSHVPEHTQLAWILNCFTYMGELNRMTQFKDKSKQHAANINVGLFAYPVLMAADILLYDTKQVPVGHDQKQHLELARDLALRFNNIYGEIFTVPEPYIPEVGGRIMSLQDPTKKMSKSDPNEHNTLFLLDTPEQIRKKLKRATTDSETEVRYDVNNKPGVSNLLVLYSIVSHTPISELETQYAGKGYGVFKGNLAEAIIHFLAPIQQRYHELRSNTEGLNKILQHSAKIARERANKTLTKIHEVLGFIPE
jgi:tryptophanyl-tRNA synthetase